MFSLWPLERLEDVGPIVNRNADRLIFEILSIIVIEEYTVTSIIRTVRSNTTLFMKYCLIEFVKILCPAFC